METNGSLPSIRQANYTKAVKHIIMLYESGSIGFSTYIYHLEDSRGKTRVYKWHDRKPEERLYCSLFGAICITCFGYPWVPSKRIMEKSNDRMQLFNRLRDELLPKYARGERPINPPKVTSSDEMLEFLRGIEA